jgi:branched-chain amino acid transport system substrate-binding protein
MLRKSLALAIAALVCGLPLSAVSQQKDKISDGVVKIGLILDMSSLYSDITGEGSVTAARMAIEDFGGKVLGTPIELVYADHQNKADIAANKAQRAHPRGRAHGARHVPVRGEVAAGIEIALGLLQAARHHPGRGGVPAAVEEHLPLGEEITRLRYAPVRNSTELDS